MRLRFFFFSISCCEKVVLIAAASWVRPLSQSTKAIPSHAVNSVSKWVKSALVPYRNARDALNSMGAFFGVWIVE